jgi:hypothetical protein
MLAVQVSTTTNLSIMQQAMPEERQFVIQTRLLHHSESLLTVVQLAPSDHSAQAITPFNLAQQDITVI